MPYRQSPLLSFPATCSGTSPLASSGKDFLPRKGGDRGALHDRSRQSSAAGRDCDGDRPHHLPSVPTERAGTVPGLFHDVHVGDLALAVDLVVGDEHLRALGRTFVVHRSHLPELGDGSEVPPDGVVERPVDHGRRGGHDGRNPSCRRGNGGRALSASRDGQEGVKRAERGDPGTTANHFSRTGGLRVTFHPATCRAHGADPTAHQQSQRTRPRPEHRKATGAPLRDKLHIPRPIGRHR